MAKDLREKVGKQYKGTRRTRQAVHGECSVELAKWTFPVIVSFSREPCEYESLTHGSNGGYGETYREVTRPVPTHWIESVLARDLDDLEPHLMRHGYNAKALADLLNVRPAEIRAFLAGRLPPSRTQ